MAKGLGLSGSTCFQNLSMMLRRSVRGSVVAQDPFDISVDRGLSSFDQRHKFTGNWICDLAFGDTAGLLPRVVEPLLGGWQWSGDFRLDPTVLHAARVGGAGYRAWCKWTLAQT